MEINQDLLLNLKDSKYVDIVVPNNPNINNNNKNLETVQNTVLSVFWLFSIVVLSCLESSIGSSEHRLLIVVCKKLKVFKILYNVEIFRYM